MKYRPWPTMKYRLFRIISCAVVAMLTAAFAVTSIAMADPPSSVPRIKLHRGTSLNWSGYAAVGASLTAPTPGVVTDVDGTWRVPAVALGKKSQTLYSSVWVGIDGYANGTVQQIGTEQDSLKGHAVYYAWYEMYPAAPVTIPRTVSPGDTMTAEVRYAGSNQYVLTLADSTAGWSYTTTQTSTVAERSSAEWVVEAPSLGRVLPLADFATVTLTGCTAKLGGTTAPIGNWLNDKMTMVTRRGAVKAQPSDLSGGGSSFSVTWYHQ
jgi:hypothetical protein